MRNRILWERGNRAHLALALLAGLLLRLFFVLHLPASDIDADLYKELGQSIVESHAYAYDSGNGLISTDVRVPGYPLFLSGIYIFFGESQRAIENPKMQVTLAACKSRVISIGAG